MVEVMQFDKEGTVKQVHLGRCKVIRQKGQKSKSAKAVGCKRAKSVGWDRMSCG